MSVGHGEQLLEKAHGAAIAAALDAWKAAQPVYEGELGIVEKADGPTTEVDLTADRAIRERLQAEFPSPEFGYLTEESEDSAARLECNHVWIIDPIDGTRDLIKRNGNFAIHIALAGKGSDGLWRPVVAVVYRPVAGQLYSAIANRGTRRHDVPLDPGRTALGVRVSERDSIEGARSVVSNTHRSGRLMRFIESLPIEGYWHVGSLGIKLSVIAEGGAELYVNFGLGRAKEWDTCAPHLILEEAGGRLTDLDGNAITYNNADVHLHRGLIATNGRIHEDLVKRVQDFLASEPE